eukprot:m.335785 g.335785  ORF g.335785 m.335785 type:complete len:648 (+) comp17674_c0_seq1:202-2145(+)
MSDVVKKPFKAPSWTELSLHFGSAVYKSGQGKFLYTVWVSFGIWLALRRRRQRKLKGVSKNVDSKEQILDARSRDAAIEERKFGRNAARKLLMIILPKLRSKHGVYVASYIGVLASRVLVTVKLADMGGRSGGYFGSRQWTKMFETQAVFGCWCMVGAVCSAAMKYLEKRVALSVREILYDDMIKRYLDAKKVSYYRVNVDDPPARLTSDLDLYSREAVHLLGYFLKPCIDVAHLTYVLSNRIGVKALAIFLSYFYFANYALTRVKNSLPKGLKECAMESQQLESELREHHQKIHLYREQIGLQRGADAEKKSVESRFLRLTSQMEATNRQYVIMDLLNTYVLKYGGQMVGFSVLIPREYMKDPTNSTVASVTAGFISESALLGSLANAMKDLADSFVEVPRVSGLASRVYRLVDQLLTMKPYKQYDLYKNTDEKGIMIKNLTYKPFGAGETAAPLTRQLTLNIKSGDHTIIRGVNGVGKTSLFRVLGGLWPPAECSEMGTPKSTFIFPQEPYFTIGSLADQVTYPKPASQNEFDHITTLLEKASLEDVLQYGLDEVRDWRSTLSGGQKQKLGWARLFYHKPKFALIDEGTSAVSVEMIDKLYHMAKECGATLLTIAHQELEVHHVKMLTFQGEGKWNTSTLYPGTT